MWTIYDQLIEGIDEQVRVKDLFCGLTWTAILSENDGLGLAMTTESYGIERSSSEIIGKPLKQVAKLVKSWNFYEASIGMAAINAFYNTSKRLMTNDWLQPNKDFATFGLDLSDKNISMIGHLRHDGELFEGVRSLKILEYHPREGDYPASAAEYLLPESDIVIITGSSFVNKTLPRLLELSKNAFTIICGPTTPMCQEILKQNSVNRVAGFIPIQIEKIILKIKSGFIGSPYDLGERFFIDKI